ncbi:MULTISPECIES: hypothetical protein [unclassified Mycobacterium]|uniref:hypothetical protein n=1 Tax=unclassified Mycobacterium TaxID=2642494 RepID=UPI000A506C60|nr:MULTISPECIES: hypothetical protein [unclassified Mycobacterium]
MPSDITIRDIDTIDAELQSVAALRYAARRLGRPLPSIDAADALLDERLERTGGASRLGDYGFNSRRKSA